MAQQKVGIVTECVCDLPQKILDEYDIRIIYFLIKTNRGSFYDRNEITARNVFEYIKINEEATISREPEPDVYRQTYENALETYDELIHITISSQTSHSYGAASKAVEDMGENGKRVHIFDSEHLSTGQGHLILLAAEMAKNGALVPEILTKLEECRNKVSTSFIVENVDFLYYNGRLPENIKDFCNKFSLHPVLSMKNGKLTVSKILIGKYDKACKKYIKTLLKDWKKIDLQRVFLTHAGCSAKKLEQIKEEIHTYCKPGELIVTEACATVSSNCGPNTFGILFLEK